MKLFRRIRVLTILCASAHASAAQAQATHLGPVHSLQEMFRISKVCPIERGGTELQIVPFISRTDLERERGIDLAVAYGMNDRFFVEVEWNSLVSVHEQQFAAETGTGDVTLEATFALLHSEDSPFHVAVGSAVQLPAGNADLGLGEGRVIYSPFIVLARDFPEFGDFELFTEISLSVPGNARDSFATVDEDAPRELAVNIGAAFARDTLGPMFEVGMTRELGNFAAPDSTKWYVAPGLFWRPRDGLIFGATASYGLGINSETRSMSIRLMCDL